MSKATMTLSAQELSDMWIALDQWEITLRGLRHDAKKAGDEQRVGKLTGDIQRMRNLKARNMRARHRHPSSPNDASR